MKRFIELKHVGPKGHVRALIDELLDRLEHKLRHFPAEVVSAHALFEENGSHTLYHASLTCHIPGRLIAARKEARDPGQALRGAFAELERRLEKQHPVRRQRHLRRRSARVRREQLLGLCWAMAASLSWWSGAHDGWAQEASVGSLSPEARELIKALEAKDLYLRQKAFLQLEALREPATAAVVRRYLNSRDVETRTFSVRALAAIEGIGAIPTLVEQLKRDPKPRVRVAAVLALEPLQPSDPAVLPALIEKLRDRNAEVRMAAVDAVSRVNDPSAQEAIRTRWKRERHRDVRRVLEQAMKRLGEGSS